jgi:hypothetical protein
LSQTGTFLGFEEEVETILISASMIFITLIFLLGAASQNLVVTFSLCFLESGTFFILERNSYVKRGVLKLFLVSLLYLTFSILLEFFKLGYPAKATYVLFIISILLISAHSIYLKFPSSFSHFEKVNKTLQRIKIGFLSRAKGTYLRVKKSLLQRKLSERDALLLSRNVLASYLRSEKSLNTLKMDIKDFSASTISKDQDNFLFLFIRKSLSFMIMVNRATREIKGPLFVPNINQLSYVLSKHFKTNLRVVKTKFISFGVFELGFDNSYGVYYECNFDLFSRKLQLKKAFLSHKFFSANYTSNFILNDIKRINNFKFEVVYSDGEKTHSDIVDVSNLKNVVIKKKD